MHKLNRALNRIRADRNTSSHIVLWRDVPAKQAHLCAMPAGLDNRLATMLSHEGIAQLYSHQVQAISYTLTGDDVVVVTPTASGKTLCYNLPVLNMLLNDPSGRALYLFPTKALAHDQLANLRASETALDLPACAAAYDGDTPSSSRAQIRRTARVLVSNPDMLHTGILPAHTRWQSFFAGLRFLVLDEMHQYRGVFGSHIANIIRRLWRVCNFYGSRPQIICCSATIANPESLAQRLTERKPRIVAQSGAPSGPRTLAFYNPPITNRQFGIRRSPLVDAAAVASHLLAENVQTLAFARSRLATELLTRSLREMAAHHGLDANQIQGYRGGYLARERRRIEQGIRSGAIRGIVATNALELGIDIGGLDACLLVGYPGSISSTWQQIGRAGRGNEKSVAILIAAGSPLDQYLIKHPSYFFGQAPEHAFVNPDNLHILLAHIKCAAYELPFAEGERFGSEDLAEILGFLQAAHLVRYTRGRWFWSGEGYPAKEIALRSADARNVTIASHTSAGAAHVIGQVDMASAGFLVHEGAIYIHQGKQFFVDRLDLEAGEADVHPVSTDYYTQANTHTQLSIETSQEVQSAPLCLSRGEVRVTSRVTGYKRLHAQTRETLSWGTVDLPEQEMIADGCWLTLSEELVAELGKRGLWSGTRVASRGPSWPRQRDLARERDQYHCRLCNAPERPGKQHHVHHIVPFRDFGWIAGQNEQDAIANRLDNLITLCPACHQRAEQGVAVQSSLSSLGRVLRQLIPLFLMCDPHDTQVASELLAPQTGLPTLFITESAPGGIGLIGELLAVFPELLAHAAEHIRNCPCLAGCPSCIGPVDAPEAKSQVSALLDVLISV